MDRAEISDSVTKESMYVRRKAEFLARYSTDICMHTALVNVM